MSEYCKNCFELAEKLAKREQECEALKSERFTRESLITLQEDELQLGEQLINGILKTLNLEAYDWRADQNEILTEIKRFEEKYEALTLENQEGYEIVKELKYECEELKERKLKLELNENHNKNEIKKLKKRIRKDREFFKNKISSLTLARKQFLEALDHFNWQIGLVKNDTYRKALEEIEEELKEDIYCESQECGCDDSEECLRCTKDLILDIINKAKGE